MVRRFTKADAGGSRTLREIDVLLAYEKVVHHLRVFHGDRARHLSARRVEAARRVSEYRHLRRRIRQNSRHLARPKRIDRTFDAMSSAVNTPEGLGESAPLLAPDARRRSPTSRPAPRVTRSPRPSCLAAWWPSSPFPVDTAARPWSTWSVPVSPGWPLFPTPQSSPRPTCARRSRSRAWSSPPARRPRLTSLPPRTRI